MSEPPPYDEPTPTAVWEPPDQPPPRALAAPPERRRPRLRVGAGAAALIVFLGAIAAIIVAGVVLAGHRGGGSGGSKAAAAQHAAGTGSSGAHAGSSGTGSGTGTGTSGGSGSGADLSGSAAGRGTGGSSSTGGAGTDRSGSGSPAAKTAVVPTAVGTTLDDARDAAHAAGFHKTSSHDVSGKDRVQIIDSDWRVCTQSPAAGARATTTTTVGFGVVKTGESCSGGAATLTMRDYRGEGADTARRALDGTATVHLRDVSGQGRTVILAGNWTVCGSTPAAGSTYRDGATVTLRVVKKGERCP